jgi:hypothetical protein
MADLTELFGKHAIVLVGLAALSCSPDASGEQQPSMVPSASSPMTSSTASVALGPKLAWPKATSRTWDSTTWVEISATPDGSLALGESLAAAPPHAQIGPATMDRRTGRVTVIRRFINPRAQVVSIVGDDHWIVWVEGSIEPTFADWTIYSYNRMTNEIRTLASAPPSHPTTPLVVLSMSAGTVVWSAVEATDGIFHVYAMNVDGSTIRTIAANARGPQIVWPWVVYDVKPSAGVGATLARNNLQTGEIQPLPGPKDPSYFAYDGEAVSWISADTNDIYLQSPMNSNPVHLSSGRYMQFVSINNRLVGWGQDAGAIAYDRKLHKIVQLSNLYDYYPIISEGALDFLFQPNASASDRFSGTLWAQFNIADLG